MAKFKGAEGGGARSAAAFKNPQHTLCLLRWVRKTSLGPLVCVLDKDIVLYLAEQRSRFRTLGPVVGVFHQENEEWTCALTEVGSEVPSIKRNLQLGYSFLFWVKAECQVRNSDPAGQEGFQDFLNHSWNVFPSFHPSGPRPTGIATQNCLAQLTLWLVLNVSAHRAAPRCSFSSSFNWWLLFLLCLLCTWPAPLLFRKLFYTQNTGDAELYAKLMTVTALAVSSALAPGISLVNVKHQRTYKPLQQWFYSIFIFSLELCGEGHTAFKWRLFFSFKKALSVSAKACPLFPPHPIYNKHSAQGMAVCSVLTVILWTHLYQGLFSPIFLCLYICLGSLGGE